MMHRNGLGTRLTRRSFLRIVAAPASLIVLGLGVQCGPTPTPQIIEKVVTQIVEKPVEQVVTTIIEKPVEVTRIVEKKVTEAKIVKKVEQPSPTPAPPPKRPERILFVGCNYVSGTNGGVDSHLRKLAASADPPLAIETGSILREGGKLAGHLKFSGISESIGEHNWDVVVLQEQFSFAVNLEDFFYDAARKLDAEIKQAGARTVFFMVWGNEKWGSNPSTEEQARVYGSIAAELGALVAPVGLAWQRSLRERPTLAMEPELSGPTAVTLHGTYLAACVFYAILLGQNIGGLPYSPEGIADEEREFLQRIAWETVQEYEQPVLADSPCLGLSTSLVL
jgi:hypothetical protein